MFNYWLELKGEFIPKMTIKDSNNFLNDNLNENSEN